jgi:hypothetical protein
MPCTLLGPWLCLGLVGIRVDDLLLGLFIGLDHGFLRVVGGFGDFLLGLGRCLGAVFRIGLRYFLVGVGDLLVGLGWRLGFLLVGFAVAFEIFSSCLATSLASFWLALAMSLSAPVLPVEWYAGWVV